MIWFSTDITFIVWLLFRLVAVGFDFDSSLSKPYPA
ncbi:hypothetical protein MARHY1047 [Marinobacter nauticus ATCC 49840]|nr:hypothetical protein MARHY1047 [Marinobacter nauticus ATCC 49840]